MGEWARTYENGADYIESLGGVGWSPRRWHRCSPQTRGQFGLDYTERCACGAIRMACGPWMERNQTRKDRARKRREDKLPRVQVTCRECGQPYEAAEGTRIAKQRLCTDCWADAFVASGGKRY